MNITELAKQSMAMQATKKASSAKPSQSQPKANLAKEEKEESPDDSIYLIVIGLAVLADLLTGIPFFGFIFGFIFSILFFFIYSMNGCYKKSSARIIVTGVGSFLEITPIGFLPCFTLMAVTNYAIARTEKKIKNLF